MRQRIINVVFAALAWFLPFISLAQFDDLKEQLQGKKTFSEITKTFEQYLSNAPDSEAKKKLEKHFARWAYYQSLHLGPDGEFVNIAQRTYDAVQQKKIPPPDRSANGSWSFVGPASTTLNNPSANFLGLGRVDRIAFHPTNANIFYVGTPAGGLWKTTDGGNNWSALSNFIPSLGISGIVVDHSNPNNIYVLTGDGDSDLPDYFVKDAGYLQLSVGVLVSHDAGETWEQTNKLYDGDYTGFRLVQDPVNANTLLAATSKGIYRTTDGGDNWVNTYVGRFFDIEFKPGNSSRVYASGTPGFRYSTDNGETWLADANFDHDLCVEKRIELAVTPDAGNKVFLLAGPKLSGNTFCGFYVSADSGFNFTRLCNSPNIFGDENGEGDQSDYDMGLAVAPTYDKYIIAAGLITYKSTDGGNNFVYKTTYSESGGNYIHPDIHAVEFNPLNGYLYALGDGGIYVSTDNGETYSDIYSGLNTSQFYGLDDYDAYQYALLAGCQDNGVKYRITNTLDYDHIGGGDGADVIINYTDFNKGYAVINNYLFIYTNFTTSNPTYYEFPTFFPEIELNSSNPDMMYAGYSRLVEFFNGIYVGFMGEAGIRGAWALKTCPSNSSRIYAAGGEYFHDQYGDMFVSSNSGVDWSTISDNTGFPSSYQRISDIGVESDYSAHVWVTFSGYWDGVKVYYSDNSGNNWYDKSYDLPNIPIWTIEVDGDGNAYVGTDYGVFYLENGATNWEPFYNGLPNVPVTELALNETSGILHAATFGRGIWKSTTRDPCPATSLITHDVEGRYFRSASLSITMTGKLTGGEGTSVWLRSGNYVDLKPGFQADGDPGNKFLAYVGNCGDGMPPEFSFGNPADTNNLTGHFSYSLARNLGTLEIKNVSPLQKKVIVRLFNDKTAKVKVFLSDENGRFIKDITQFRGVKGKSEYTFQTDDLKQGLYYLYLGIDRDVNHLQELVVTEKE